MSEQRRSRTLATSRTPALEPAGRVFLCVASLAILLAAPSSASANGRFPESNQLVFAEHDPNLVILRVTFGLLISHDRGQTFEWVCEESIGYSGVEDPMYTVTPSNAMIATTFQGVSITRNRGCNWSYAGGDLSGGVFIDLSANPNDPNNVVFFESTYDRQDEAGKVYFTSRVWETKDEGQTFQQLGPPLDTSILGYTIDRTKTDPDRIYASVVRNPGPQPEGVLLTSKNHGQSWVEEPVPLIAGERSFYIAAVDPTNAERVYLRTYAASPDKPTRLILREAPDGGAAPTQRTVYTAVGALPGFVLTADGSKVYVGGPNDGVQVASTTDFVFSQRSTLEVQCLGMNADGLWACSNEQMGFIAGLSKDDGVSFEPKLRFCGIAGPVASCGPETATGHYCGQRWSTQQVLLGCADGGVPADAGFTDAGPGFSPTAPPAKPGCDCQSTPASPWGAFASALAAGLTLLRWARRKRPRG